MPYSALRRVSAALALIAFAGTAAPAAWAGQNILSSPDIRVLQPQAETNTIDPSVVTNPDIVPVPDLEVAGYHFVPGPAKAVVVTLRNNGAVAVPPSVIRLTVRRIAGIAVGRVVEAAVPAFSPHSNYVVSIAAAGILPNIVDLASTTFRLDADATGAVFELNETNNTRWHNL